MDIKAKIIKRKSGKSKGLYVVRIKFFDESLGRYKNLERHAETKTKAVDLRNSLELELKQTDGNSLSGEKMLFGQLANVYEKRFYQPAVVAAGKRISGIRSPKTKQAELKKLREFFGNRRIRDIRKESLTDYKVWRLKTPSEKTKRPVSITTLNKELSTMRTLFRYAYGEGWVLRDVFFNSKVIDKAAEIERKRVLSVEEEKRILSVCIEEREHLKPMLILAVDSGLRRGEIFRLFWSDVNFEKKEIRILASNTKTERERFVPMSARVEAELMQLKGQSSEENQAVFQYKGKQMTEIKRSFNTAKKLAKIQDLHFHDLRRTAITRWIQQGTALALAGKAGGHNELETTLRHYVANDSTTIAEIAKRMDDFNSEMFAVDVQTENDLMN